MESELSSSFWLDMFPEHSPSSADTSPHCASVADDEFQAKTRALGWTQHAQTRGDYICPNKMGGISEFAKETTEHAEQSDVFGLVHSEAQPESAGKNLEVRLVPCMMMTGGLFIMTRVT